VRQDAQPWSAVPSAAPGISGLGLDVLDGVRAGDEAQRRLLMAGVLILFTGLPADVPARPAAGA